MPFRVPQNGVTHNLWISFRICCDANSSQILLEDTMQAVSREFQRVLAKDEENGVPARYKALAIKLSEYLAKETSAA